MDSHNLAMLEISKLPKEMLEKILQRLPFRDLLKCREVNSTWKNAATNPLRKKCAPLDFSWGDLRSTGQSIRAVKNFIQLIGAANEQGGLKEFPLTKLYLNLYSDYYWIEVNGSTLICQLLEAVSPVVKEVNFNFRQSRQVQVPNNSLVIFKNLSFPNLTELTLRMVDHRNNHCDRIMFSLIRRVIETSPNVKELHLFFTNAIRSEDAMWHYIVETGIQQRATLVTSLTMAYEMTQSDLEYFHKLGFKLKHFRVELYRHDNVNPEVWKKFLESQSNTLTFFSLTFRDHSYHYFRELPCLPLLKNLSIYCFDMRGPHQLPTLFYKEQLPALKKLDLQYVYNGAHYFMESHMAPSESLRELILPNYPTNDAGQVIRQVALIFPNLKKLQVSHRNVNYYMRDIYEALPGIEELCISTDGLMTVDDIITGLPKRILRKIREESPPSYYWSKAVAMLERGHTKSLTCLKNLKILQIYRSSDEYRNIVGEADFTELSGVVLKQMMVLERIDFGIRKYGPIVSAALKQDLQSHGIKLFYRLPPYTPSRTDFIVSVSESEESDSDSDASSGSDLSD